jgi:nucleoside-diphosphate-sugar epimerase
MKTDNNIKSILNNKNILITGSNGFVGRNLIEELQKYECKIFGIDISDNKNKNIQFFRCDLTNRNELKKIVDDITPNYIFHLAAIVSAVRDYSLFPNMLSLHVQSLYNLFEILKNSNELEFFINFGTKLF